MNFITRLPELPEDEGRFWAHSTGGEHATKFAGSELAFNPIRAVELSRHDGAGIEPISGNDFFDMLFSRDQEVIIVHRHDLPEDALGRTGLIGLAIGERAQESRFHTSMTVRELVVHPDLRQKRVASFMLGRLTSSEFGASGLSEMVFDTSTYKTEDWLTEKLTGMGFKHVAEDGSPAIWLPGSYGMTRGEVDSQEKVDELLGHAPEGWNGYIDVYPNDDFKTLLLRDGKVIGAIRPVEDTRAYNRQHEPVNDLALFDAGDVRLGIVEGAQKDMALTALLNNYELVS